MALHDELEPLVFGAAVAVTAIYPNCEFDISGRHGHGVTVLSPDKSYVRYSLPGFDSMQKSGGLVHRQEDYLVLSFELLASVSNGDVDSNFVIRVTKALDDYWWGSHPCFEFEHAKLQIFGSDESHYRGIVSVPGRRQSTFDGG